MEKIEHSEKFEAGNPNVVSDYLKMICRIYFSSSQKADDLVLKFTHESSIKWKRTSECFNHVLFSKAFDLKKDLTTLNYQTLIIHGANDPIPLCAAQALHKNIRHSKLVVLEDCGHFPYVEKPSDLFSILTKFLGGKSL